MRHTNIFAPTAYPIKEYTIGSTSFRMIQLPGHSNFTMGNNEGEEESYRRKQPRHDRQINPFTLAEFPVTQQLWKEVVARARVQGLLEEQALPLNPAYSPGPNRPVESVNWHEAREFCRVLNLLLDKPEDFFRLPSDAEWEYAARAGKRETVYAGSNHLAGVGWYDGNNEQETVPVGLLSPNDFGLYDLSGNVWEWCEDDWHNNYDNHPQDGQAWIDDPGKRAEYRVRRGGSWLYYARDCRCAHRLIGWPGLRDRDYGFRLAAPVR
jgi:formylglycine-generating enzyme required for sulfatase activity